MTTPGPRYTDPLHVPGDEPTRDRLRLAYEEGVADGHRIHVLALVLMIGLGFVIGFVIAGSVFAASRSGQPVEVSVSPPRQVAPATAGRSEAPPAPLAAPTQLSDEGGISSALVAGTASWYDVGPGMYGAVPSYRWGDPRYKVRVCRLDKPSRCVTVTVLDFCGCPGSRVIDLSRQAFARLESPSRGLVAVTVESGGVPAATLPATDVP